MKKILFAVLITMILLSSISFSQETIVSKNYFPLKKGNFWIYKISTGAHIRYEVTGMKTIEGKRYFVMSSSPVKGNIEMTETYFADSTGVYLHNRSNKTQNAVFEPDQLFIKYPLKPGMTWTWKGISENDEMILNFSVADFEIINIKNVNINCLKMTVKYSSKSLKPDYSDTYWLADNIWIVKQITEASYQGKSVKISRILDYYKNYLSPVNDILP